MVIDVAISFMHNAHQSNSLRLSFMLFQTALVCYIITIGYALSYHGIFPYDHVMFLRYFDFLKQCRTSDAETL